MKDFVLLIARLLMAVVFVWSGWNKLMHYDYMQGYMVSLGVPGWSMPILVLWELGGGLAFALGLFTRPVAVTLAVFCVVSACIAHSNFADLNQFIHFLKNTGLAGGYLAFAVAGAGAFSLDRKFKLKWA